MRNNQKRYLLHAAGILCLALLGPLGNRYGVTAGVVLLVLALGCFVTSGFIRPEGKDPKHPYESPYEVQFDDVEVRVLFKGKPHENVAWSEIKVVGVQIDESFLPAPWWVLSGGTKSGCLYPSEAKGSMEMLTELQRRLPGFDNKAVVVAMGLMEGGMLVWSAKPKADEATLESDPV
jgi:hypothetical protein